MTFEDRIEGVRCQRELRQQLVEEARYRVAEEVRRAVVEEREACAIAALEALSDEETECPHHALRLAADAIRRRG